MAHFAQIDENSIVTQVIVIDNSELLDDSGTEQEMLGRQFCSKLLGGNWVQTSYNANFRKHFAGVGFRYDPVKDAFIPPKPYASWLLDEENYKWVSPIPYPTDGKQYIWNESSKSWNEAITS